MPRLVPIKPKRLKKMLHKNGFLLEGIEGSHMKYFNPVTKARTSVPFGLSEIPIGTFKSIIRQSKLPEKLFRR